MRETRSSGKRKAAAEGDGEQTKKAEVENGGKPSAKARKTSGKGGPAAETAPAGALKVGDVCPDFEITLDDGSTNKLHELVKSQGAVIFAYPKANTPGCTKQAQGFRDNHADILAAGYQVFGISQDSTKSQTNWKNKHELPYSLLSDLSKDKAALKALGFLAGDKTKRSHVVMDAGATVLQYCVGVSPGDSVDKATEFCKENPKGKGASGEAAQEEDADEDKGGAEDADKEAKDDKADDAPVDGAAKDTAAEGKADDDAPAEADADAAAAPEDAAAAPADADKPQEEAAEDNDKAEADAAGTEGAGKKDGEDAAAEPNGEEDEK